MIIPINKQQKQGTNTKISIKSRNLLEETKIKPKYKKFFLKNAKTLILEEWSEMLTMVGEKYVDDDRKEGN